jgi:hypothetical protein
MRDAWLAGTGIVFGWLMSKVWTDPGCQLGLVVFLVATAAMLLAFVLAVVGHGRASDGPGPEDDRDGE